MRSSPEAPCSQDGEITASMRSDERIRYGGAWMSAASALPLNGDAIRPRPVARLIAAAARRPRSLAALLALLVRTPTERIPLSGSTAGQALDAYFKQRSMGIVPRKRFCRGVLVLPPDHAVYLRGRRRQALRTNLRRASTAGIYCEVVSNRQRGLDETLQLLQRRWGEATLVARVGAVDSFLARSDVTVAVARDEQRRPLAMAAVLIDNEVCLIKFAAATSHEARWALHDYIVRVLIGRRVRYLMADGGGPFGALGFTSNVQHYQHLLGYELRHITPRRARPMKRRWLLAASLIVLAAVAALIGP